MGSRELQSRDLRNYVYSEIATYRTRELKD